MGNFCENCGRKLNGETTCSNCNGKIEENNQTNICAIVGFILSLVSICCCGMTSLISFGFSIVGLLNAKNYNDNTGKGFAIAGIVISSIFVVLLIIFYIIGITASLIEGYTNSVIY